MSEMVKYRCLGCGSSRTGRHFGFNEDGEHDPEEHPEHVSERIVFEMGGRNNIQVVERGDLSLEEAQAMRASIQHTLDRLDAEIAEALGADNTIADDSAMGVG